MICRFAHRNRLASRRHGRQRTVPCPPVSSSWERLIMNKKKWLYIPPYSADMVWAICLIFLGIIGYYWCVSNGKQLFVEIRWTLGLGILWLLFTCFNYALTEKGVWLCFFYIPIRLVKWSDISTAQYIRKWNKLENKEITKERGQGIFITLHNCPVFVPEIDGLHTFTLKHPFSSFFIQFTSKHQKRYIDYFREYYPDLVFQIGYEQ